MTAIAKSVRQPGSGTAWIPKNASLTPTTESANVGRDQCRLAKESCRGFRFNGRSDCLSRYGLAKDGPNEWSKRKEIVVTTIRNFDADIVGTQETLDFQATFLAEQVQDFT